MHKIPYDPTRKSLYRPGEAEDFFQFDLSITDQNSLSAEMSRLAYVKQKDRLIIYLDRVQFDLHWSIGYETNGTQLFIAKPRPSLGNQLPVVVAFRGTEPDDYTDLLADANVFKTPWMNASGNQSGTVHTGFADALLKDPVNGDILTQLSAQLNRLAEQYPAILLTGHSLGAALATLTASYLNQTPWAKNIRLYTFGSPRVGDSVFSEAMQNIQHERYVDCADLVTRVPGEWLGFIHVGRLNYIDRHGYITHSITEDAIAKDCLIASVTYITKYFLRKGNVLIRKLADHSPINYLSGVGGLRK